MALFKDGKRITHIYKFMSNLKKKPNIYLYVKTSIITTDGEIYHVTCILLSAFYLYYIKYSQSIWKYLLYCTTN